MKRVSRMTNDYIEAALQDDQGGEFIGAKTQSKKEKKPDNVLALDVEGVVDVLDAGKSIVYLMETGEAIEKVVIDGTTYIPPAKSEIPYLLPRKDETLALIREGTEGTEAFYRYVKAYHESISDLPNPLFYDLLTLWDFHTYFLEKLHFSPILYLYAVKERGKSRTGKGCLYASRRGIFTETVREADIIRWGNDHKAAIGFDVKDFPKKIERANCDDLILARFEKGSTSSRTLWPEKGAFRDTKSFKLFGPTIVMTNRPVDDIVESRAISIDMKPSSRVFNEPVMPEAALELKERLTAFRFKKWNVEMKKSEKPVPGRLGDILTPLQQIVQTFFPEVQSNFNSLVQVISAKKQEEATDTFEAQIVEAVVAAENQVVSGFLEIQEVATILNQGRNEKFLLRNETIGRVLKGMGFSSKRTSSGRKGIYYDPELIKSLVNQYGLAYVQNASEPSVPSKTYDYSEPITNQTNDLPF